MIQITIPSELAPSFRSEMPAARSSPSLGKIVARVLSRDAVSRQVRVIEEGLAADSILRKWFTEAIDVKVKT